MSAAALPLFRGMVTLHLGDTREVMDSMAPCSVDAIITDPPYELGFMAKAWDRSGVSFAPSTWVAAMRVAKPGAHLLAFGGTRTFHRLACAIEDAGWEVRDCLSWMYGTGFPKSKAALKPAWEPIILARRPLAGTVAANIGAHGTGGLNIYGCRSAGRWPANVVLDEEAAEALDEQSGPTVSLAHARHNSGSDSVARGAHRPHVGAGYADFGGASRFFYCAKASRAERGEGNDWPTVKPLSLMRWLCRLVTPPGGVILDPFHGSGSTLLAACEESFMSIGIDSNPGARAIVDQRLAAIGGAS